MTSAGATHRFRGAQADHIEQSLERVGVELSPRRAALDGLGVELVQVRQRQSDLLEMGAVRAVECLQESIEGMEHAIQFLKGGQE